MSTHRKIEYALFLLGLGGMSFAGYLAGVKFFSQTCAFNEACPYFLGIPACYVGFFLFTAITFFAGLHVFHLYDGEKANYNVLLLAVTGVLFAGYFSFIELPTLIQNGFSAYFFSLPTCMYGLFFFLAIALFSYRLRKDFIK
jgi:hypothetical protein